MSGDLGRRSTIALTTAIRRTLTLPGYRPGLGGGCRIPPLPFETTLRLHDVDLNTFLARSLPEPEDAANLFEMCLDSIVFPDEDDEPQASGFTWFMREAGLTNAQGRCLLPTAATPMQIATVLLWMCARDRTSTLTPDRFTVTTDEGDLMGFADGVALSEFPRLRQRHPPCDFVRTLAKETIQRDGFSRTGAFNAVWIRAHRHRGPEREALILALQILHWRSKNTIRAVEYLYGI